MPQTVNSFCNFTKDYRLSMKKSAKKLLRKKRFQVLLIVITVLFVFRLLLPIFLKNYVNKVLANIPSYYGEVESIDIDLYRGAYKIHGLFLNKVDAGSNVPFLDFPETNISIEWGAIFNGKVVSEISMREPKVIYVFEDQKDDSVKAEAWTRALTDLVPIDINRFEVINGTSAFVQLQADPTIDLNLKQINLVASNLRNVIQKERILPSSLKATAVSIGGGNVEMNGTMNLIKEIPDIDIEFSLKNADATALNDFTEHYAKIDFDSGQFEVYGEVAIADGYLKGSIKPILENGKLLGKDDNFLGTLWEGFVGFFKFVLKNQKKNTLATKIPIEGDLNNVDAKIWPSVTGIFKNAWIKAFKEVIDDDISFKDAEVEADKKQKK